MHAVENDYNERLVSSDVSYAGGSKRQRPPTNLFRNVIIAFLLCLICVVVFWITTGVFRNDNPQTGFNVGHGKQKRTAMVVFLHGLAGDGVSACERRVAKMNLPPHIRYICPTADIMTVVFGGNNSVHSWFNIFDLTQESKEDEPGIKSAAGKIESLIDKEVALGIPRCRIVLGGNSQGGATSLYTALTSTKPPLAGIFALSSWLPLLKTFPQAFKGNKATPLFQSHGEADKLVPISFGLNSSRAISAYNSNAKMITYPGIGHTSSSQVYKDLKKFIVECLPPIQTDKTDTY